jgi:hypothetical protein
MMVGDFGAQEGAAHPTRRDFGSEGVDFSPGGCQNRIDVHNHSILDQTEEFRNESKNEVY